MEDTVVHNIRSCVRRRDFETAIFFAEHLHAHLDSPHSRHLLADVLVASNEVTRAYCVLKDACVFGVDIAAVPRETRYLFAYCCYKLKNYNDAEGILLRHAPHASTLYGEASHADEEKLIRDMPGGACGLHLLGRVYKAMGRSDDAAVHFQRALEVDNHQWSSFRALCELGKATDDMATSLFTRETPAKPSQKSPLSDVTNGSTSSGPSDGTVELGIYSLSFEPHLPTHKDGGKQDGESSAEKGGKSSGTSSSLPSRSTRTSGRSVAGSGPATRRNTNRKRQRGGTSLSRHASPARSSSTRSSNAVPPVIGRSSSTGPSHAGDVSTAANDSKGDASSAGALAPEKKMPRGSKNVRARKSVHRGGGRQRANTITGGVQTRSGSASGAARRRNAANANETAEQKQSSELENDASNMSALSAFLASLRFVSRIVQLVRSYECTKALELLATLDEDTGENRALDVPWSGTLLEFIGRAHFELASFKKASEVFETLQKQAPHHFDGLEFYSVCLWYSKDEMKLSYLAQTMMEKDRLWHGTWVILGNCFSLQKDHATAIKYFKRALQLCPEYAYAYTLAAHEYIASEDYDKAIEGFRNAMHLDKRHYNAWYGLGTIHFRQENYDMAEHHFVHAHKINPESSILCCYIGMTFSSKQDHEAAVQWLHKATKLKESNHLAQYELANEYSALGRTGDAIVVLTRLSKMSPKEASVHYSLGQAHQKIGNTQLAMRSFSRCLDLNPKDKNLVKAAIDSVGAAQGSPLRQHGQFQ